MEKVTIKDVYEQVSALRNEIHQNYVTKDEFEPVRNITYGIVGLALTTLVAALLAQVVRASF